MTAPVVLLDTVNATETVTGAAPPVIVMLVEYPPTVSPVAFTESVRLAGVVPVVGLIVSQFALGETEVVKLTAGVLDNCTLFEFGVVPPNT